MFVKPASPELIVRDPAKRFQPIPAEGIEVGTDNAKYWQRRIDDGDVLIAQPPAEEKPKKK